MTKLLILIVVLSQGLSIKGHICYIPFINIAEMKIKYLYFEII